jgi:hypothetical protein
MIVARISKTGYGLLLTTVLAATTFGAPQVGPNTAQLAPVPPQILAAKKVFISNVPGEQFSSPRNAEDDLYRPYNQFYALLKGWGYYELVSAPGDADLILEIRLSGRPVLNNATVQAPVFEVYLEATLRDPKTQAVLWWLSERLQGANRKATGEKNYNQAMTNLVNDLKTLVGQPPAATSDAKR